MINAGIIGLGKMGLSHCAILNAHPEVNLVGVCDTSKFNRFILGKYSQLECFDDYNKMLKEKQLDCLFIATPTRFHADMATQGLELGLHLFVEKPFCLDPADSVRLSRLAADKGLVTQVGYHNRFVGSFCEAQRLLAENIIGEVHHYLAEAYGPVVLKEKGGTWRSSATEGGGCLYDYASHVVNLTEFLVGPANKASGSVLQSIFSKGVDDAVYSTLTYKDGKSGQISVNWSDETYRKMTTQVTLFGKAGKLFVDQSEVRIHLQKDNEGHKLKQGWNTRYITDVTEPVDYYLRGEEYSAQVDNFIQAIKEGRTDNINSFASAASTDAMVAQIRSNSQEQ